jgi:DNA polymerase-1
LAQRLNIPRQEASDVIENYFAEYPQVKVYMDSQIAHARRHGHVKTLFGRQRTLRDINSSNSNQRGFAERNAINSPIQGTAADLIKKAMVDIQGDIKKHRLASRMTLQVHDELIFDAHNDELDVLKPLITDKMQNVLDLAVPLEVEIGVGANWLQAH